MYGNQLPFTGISALLYGAIGAVSLIVGVVGRRVAGSDTPTE